MLVRLTKKCKPIEKNTDQCCSHSCFTHIHDSDFDHEGGDDDYEEEKEGGDKDDVDGDDNADDQ